MSQNKIIKTIIIFVTKVKWQCLGVYLFYLPPTHVKGCYAYALISSSRINIQIFSLRSYSKLLN